MGFPRQEYWSELPFLLSGGQGIAKHLTMSRIAPVRKEHYPAPNVNSMEVEKLYYRVKAWLSEQSHT